MEKTRNRGGFNLQGHRAGRGVIPLVEVLVLLISLVGDDDQVILPIEVPWNRDRSGLSVGLTWSQVGGILRRPQGNIATIEVSVGGEIQTVGPHGRVRSPVARIEDRPGERRLLARRRRRRHRNRGHLEIGVGGQVDGEHAADARVVRLRGTGVLVHGAGSVRRDYDPVIAADTIGKAERLPAGVALAGGQVLWPRNSPRYVSEPIWSSAER